MSATGLQSEQVSDAALMARVASGDERALGELYDRHGHTAYGLALAITDRETDAERVVADAFSDVWKNAAATTWRSGDRSAATWIMTVVRRRALAMRPAGSGARIGGAGTVVDERGRDRTPDGNVSPTGRGGGAAPRQPSGEAVVSVLRALPAPQRLVLELAYFRGLPVREIAREIHETEHAVGSHLRLAMDALRRVAAMASSTTPAQVARV